MLIQESCRDREISISLLYCLKGKDLRILSSFKSIITLKEAMNGGFHGTSFGKIVSKETSNEPLKCMTVTSIQESLRPGKMVGETG